MTHFLNGIEAIHWLKLQQEIEKRGYTVEAFADRMKENEIMFFSGGIQCLPTEHNYQPHTKIKDLTVMTHKYETLNIIFCTKCGATKPLS